MDGSNGKMGGRMYCRFWMRMKERTMVEVWLRGLVGFPTMSERR